jgi:predicted DCC family thiol-disulfide oxidoreductase YuxK
MSSDRVFYDGTCGLCHRTVRFLLVRDADGRLFRFAPLQGAVAREILGDRLDSLPDSIVVVTPDRDVLTRSAAILRGLTRLGGAWRFLARLAALVPRRARDVLYDWIARNRYRLFARPENACPVLSPELRKRFDL